MSDPICVGPGIGAHRYCPACGKHIRPTVEPHFCVARGALSVDGLAQILIEADRALYPDTVPVPEGEATRYAAWLLPRIAPREATDADIDAIIAAGEEWSRNTVHNMGAVSKRQMVRHLLKAALERLSP